MPSNAAVKKKAAGKAGVIPFVDDRAATGELPIITPQMLANQPSGSKAAGTAKRKPTRKASPEKVARSAAKNAKAEQKQREKDLATSAKDRARKQVSQSKERQRERKREQKAAAKAEKAEARRLRRRKVLMVTGATLVVLIAAGFLIYPSAQQYYRTLRENERLQAVADALNSRNAQIQQNIDNLNTDEGIEDQARTYGWTKEGENAVNVTNTGEVTATTSIPESVDVNAVTAPDTWYSVVLDPFFGVE